MFVDLHAWGRQDWDQFTFRYETARLALVRDGQWPMWNPFANGGTVLAAHPHNPAASPWFAIVLLLGTPLGLRVQVTLALAAGAIGMARLTRECGADRWGQIAGGAVYAFSAHPVLHLAEGHVEWTVMGLMPWVARPLMDWHRDHPARAVVAAAALFASAVLLGAVYIPAIFALLFSTWALAESLRARSSRPLRHWAAVVLLAAALAAVKLLPMAYFLRHAEVAPASVGHATSPRTLLAGLFDPRQVEAYQTYRGFRAGGLADVEPPANAPTYPWGPLTAWDLPFEFQEYGAYIGVVGWGLVPLGLALAWRRHWPWILSGGLSLWLVLGAAAPIDLWGLVRTLPLYDGLHVPSRWLAGVVFVLALGVAAGMTALTTRRPTRPWLAPLCTALLVVELGVFAHRTFSDVFVIAPIALPPASSFDHTAAPPAVAALTPAPMHSVLTPLLAAGHGTLGGYENRQVPRGRVRPPTSADYRGPAWLTGATGTAVLTGMTMNTVEVAIQATRPTLVVLNQNYFLGWRADALYSNGGAMRIDVAANADGLISAGVDPEVAAVRFRYRSPLLPAGLAVTLLALAAGVLIWRRA
jgi:hypothetical protein